MKYTDQKKCKYAHIDPMQGQGGRCVCSYCGEVIHEDSRTTSTDHTLTRSVAEIKEICDDSYQLSDDDWTKKYGEKMYWQVISDQLHLERQNGEKLFDLGVEAGRQKVLKEVLEKVAKMEEQQKRVYPGSYDRCFIEVLELLSALEKGKV